MKNKHFNEGDLVKIFVYEDIADYPSKNGLLVDVYMTKENYWAGNVLAEDGKIYIDLLCNMEHF